MKKLTCLYVAILFALCGCAPKPDPGKPATTNESSPKVSDIPDNIPKPDAHGYLVRTYPGFTVTTKTRSTVVRPCKVMLPAGALPSPGKYKTEFRIGKAVCIFFLVDDPQSATASEQDIADKIFPASPDMNVFRKGNGWLGARKMRAPTSTGIEGQSYSLSKPGLKLIVVGTWNNKNLKERDQILKACDMVVWSIEPNQPK